MKTPRGIRNNNPGNLRIANNNWQGKIPVSENTDGEFEQFEAMPYGVRALVKTVSTYIRNVPNITLRGIIERYAPSSENNTIAYVNSVASYMSMGTEQPAKDWFYQIDFLTAFVKAIIKHENGRMISESDVTKGIEMTNFFT